MGRYVEKSTESFVPNYTENATESNASRFTCRCIYTTPGSYTFTVPSGVCSITAVAVGPGGCANCVVKLSEKYIYKTCDYLCHYRNKTLCVFSPLCCFCTGFGCDPSGMLCSYTYFCSSFRLGGYVLCSCTGAKQCFRSNYDTVYTQLDYGIIDSGPGGGYSEKEITTTPGSTFCVLVGVSTGNNFSCINGQICATGPCIVNGTGISTETQYTCFCCNACESYYCCNSPGSCIIETYCKSGPVCYIKEKRSDSCVIPGCGYGGSINRSGGFGCSVRSFCFPLGFDELGYDQCSCVCVCTSCCGPSPFLCITRSINLSTNIVTDINSPLSVCPSDLATNHCCYFPCGVVQIYNGTCCVFCIRGGMVRRNTFNYSDSIAKQNIFVSESCCAWSPLCNFTIPSCYCGVCFSSSCTNFIGIVTNLSNINCLSVFCNTSGGSSSGSPCFNGVYQPPSCVCECTNCSSTADLPTITSCATGRPVFSDSSCLVCIGLIETRVYGSYDPTSTNQGCSRAAIITNTGCNPCNCRDIGCFFCTCRFDVIKNMWGIVSGPACFAYGATGIGNSLTLCDPLRFARSVGACASSCPHLYSACCSGYGMVYCCCNCCNGCISYYGTAYTDLATLYCALYGCCRCENAFTNIACESGCYGINAYYCNRFCICNSSCACRWPSTSHWPSCLGYNLVQPGTCCTAIPVFNLYELLCDSSGKCVSFCSTCTDAGKQFQTSLGEHGLDVIRVHFSPCACSAKCFGSYNNWPCYFAATGAGTTIPCGGDSPLVPRQELTVCDPRYIPNNYHNICIALYYCLGCRCEVWASGGCCIFCNSFATASSNLYRGFKIGTNNEAGAGTGYTGVTCNTTCCYAYVTAAAGSCSSIQTYCDRICVSSGGGGGGHYSTPCVPQIVDTGRCAAIILAPSGGRGWGDFNNMLVDMTTGKVYNQETTPKVPTWFDTRQAKGSGASAPVCINGKICYPAVKAGAGGGGIGGYGNEYASTCVFGGAACSGTAGPGGGAGGQGVPGTGMVVIYWNP